MDHVTYAIKESKLLVLCVSDSFVQDEKSIQVYELTKNIIKKNYILVEFGYLGSHKWLSNPLMAATFHIQPQDLIVNLANTSDFRLSR